MGDHQAIGLTAILVYKVQSMPGQQLCDIARLIDGVLVVPPVIDTGIIKMGLIIDIAADIAMKQIETKVSGVGNQGATFRSEQYDSRQTLWRLQMFLFFPEDLFCAFRL